MKLPLRLIFAHAKKTWVRTLLTAGSVFIAVFIFGFFQLVLNALDAPLNALKGNRLVVESAISLFANLPKRLQSDIEAIDGVKNVGSWTWYGGVYKNGGQEHMWGRFGVEPKRLREIYGTEMILEEDEWDRFISMRTACIVGQDLAAKEELTVGSKVPLVGNLFAGKLELEVVGIYKSATAAFDQETLFMHWDYMNEASRSNDGRTEVVSTFIVELEEPTLGPAVQASIDAMYDNSSHRTRTLTERAFQSQFNEMWGNLPLFFSALSMVVLTACFMVTANTLVLNARERIREVGVLKSLGFTPGSVAVMSLLEGMFICGLGGAGALLLIGSVHGSPLIFGWRAAVTPDLVVKGTALVVALGLVSAAVPAWMAWRLPIVDALRRRA